VEQPEVDEVRDLEVDWLEVEASASRAGGK
jgi:hypothetical protein